MIWMGHELAPFFLEPQMDKSTMRVMFLRSVSSTMQTSINMTSKVQFFRPADGLISHVCLIPPVWVEWNENVHKYGMGSICISTFLQTCGWPNQPCVSCSSDVHQVGRTYWSHSYWRTLLPCCRLTTVAGEQTAVICRQAVALVTLWLLFRQTHISS